MCCNGYACPGVFIDSACKGEDRQGNVRFLVPVMHLSCYGPLSLRALARSCPGSKSERPPGQGRIHEHGAT